MSPFDHSGDAPFNELNPDTSRSRALHVCSPLPCASDQSAEYIRQQGKSIWAPLETYSRPPDNVPSELLSKVVEAWVSKTCVSEILRTDRLFGGLVQDEIDTLDEWQKSVFPSAGPYLSRVFCAKTDHQGGGPRTCDAHTALSTIGRYENSLALYKKEFEGDSLAFHSFRIGLNDPVKRAKIRQAHDPFMSYHNSSWRLHTNPQSGKKPEQTSMVKSVPPPSYTSGASKPSQGFVNPAEIFNPAGSAGTGTSSYSCQTQVTMGPYGQSNNELPGHQSGDFHSSGNTGVRKRARITTSHDQGTEQNQQPSGLATGTYTSDLPSSELNQDYQYRTYGQQATNPYDAQSAVPQGHSPQPSWGPPPS